MKTTFAALIAGAALAACSAAPAQPQPTPAPSPAPASPVPPTPAPTRPLPTATPAPVAPPSRGAPADGASIVYVRSGGIAGATLKWSIYADGRVITDKGEERRVDPAKVADALSRIEALKVFDLDGAGAPGPGCPDCFKYTVTVSIGGKTATFSTFDAAPNTPPAVTQIVQIVSNLAAGR